MALLEEYLPSSQQNPWLLSLSKVAVAFGLTKVQVSQLIQCHKNMIAGVPKMPHHCPPKITKEQLEIVKNFVNHCENNERNPPEPSVLCDFILSTFGIDYHQISINSLVKKYQMFHIVDAKPLESEQIEVAVEDLHNNHKTLVEMMDGIDPHLIVNIDESGWGKKLNLFCLFLFSIKSK